MPSASEADDGLPEDEDEAELFLAWFMWLHDEPETLPYPEDKPAA